LKKEKEKQKNKRVVSEWLLPCRKGDVHVHPRYLGSRGSREVFISMYVLLWGGFVFSIQGERVALMFSTFCIAAKKKKIVYPVPYHLTSRYTFQF